MVHRIEIEDQAASLGQEGLEETRCHSTLIIGTPAQSKSYRTPATANVCVVSVDAVWLWCITVGSLTWHSKSCFQQTALGADAICMLLFPLVRVLFDCFECCSN